MRLNCREGNDASLAERTSRITARIARTVFNVVVCTTFVRSVLTFLSPAAALLPTTAMSADRRRIRRFAGLSTLICPLRSMRAILP